MHTARVATDALVGPSRAQLVRSWRPQPLRLRGPRTVFRRVNLRVDQ